MKRLNNTIFSMQLTGVLLMLFAITIGAATFIENDFGTEAAKAKVYNATWFEVMLLLMAINMAGSIFKHKMITNRKWSILLFHVAFLVIFIGSAITRYISYEGTLSIREGKSNNELVTAETYIQIWASENDTKSYSESKVFATPVSVEGLTDKFKIGDKSIEFKVNDYYSKAGETIVEEEGGEPLLWLVVSKTGFGGRSDLYIREGESKSFGGHNFVFNGKAGESDFIIQYDGTEPMFQAADSVEYMNMMANTKVMLPPDSVHPLLNRALYKYDEISIVVKQFYKSAKTKLVSTEGEKGMSSMDAFNASITIGEESTDINVFGGKGYRARHSEVVLNGVKLMITYGAKTKTLPFSLRLDDFQLDRYPGSNSPESYASQVTVIDEANQLEMPYRIYMNNVLNYGGYRFFQSSYDQDELGTILSVNHDAWGTIITYIGYFLMSLGMIVTIFSKSSRFASLSRMSAQLRGARKVSIWIVLFASSFIFSSLEAKANTENIPTVDAAHAKKFGRLLVLDREGRVKPVNTIASEMLRKVARKSSFEGQSPEQVFLGIAAFTDIWQEVPFIKVGHPELQNYLSSGKLASFNQIVDVNTPNGYTIREFVEKAYNKNPSKQSTFDKEVMKVDERVNIFFMVYSGAFLNIFPVPENENNKWIKSTEASMYLEGDEALFVKGILGMYYDEVRKAVSSGDWTAADEHLEYIFSYQNKYGAEVIPPESKVSMEIFYNNYDIFQKLSRYFGLIGFILLIFHFINILKPRINLKWVIRIASYLIVLLFLVHTAGLALRWYISGHAPWSDGYESLIFIGWATILAGLIFVRKSQITLSATALLASLILMVAHLSWMDPEITNLVPVLKSYWLVIHVAIITGSYGFLALGALLGFFNLLLYNLKTKKNHLRLDMTITELTYIIEMTLVVGLFMLTIGTFLGGVWANESWGRYWGWDPKETWALATVLFYSFVLHMRFIPGFRGNFAMSFAALISYASVLMTYFGVNYYLSGLHSYAKGDPVPVPSFVYYTLIVVAVVSIMAYITENRINKGTEDKKTFK
jgi:cytochrome c-type biogenesis protein CcsB